MNVRMRFCEYCLRPFEYTYVLPVSVRRLYTHFHLILLKLAGKLWFEMYVCTLFCSVMYNVESVICLLAQLFLPLLSDYFAGRHFRLEDVHVVWDICLVIFGSVTPLS